MAWAIIGGVCEVVGLGVAAYGLFLTWRGVAEGHPFIPLPRRRRVHGGGAAGAFAFGSASAYGYAAEPGESVDDKLARVYAELGKLHAKIEAETRARKADATRLEGAITESQRAAESERKADARADTRLAAGGLALAVLGVALQMVGTVAMAG